MLKPISYKDLCELVRYWMVRIYACSILLGVEPYLTKGKQCPPLVQWNFKHLREGVRAGENATTDNVWNIPQTPGTVNHMMLSPKGTLDTS